MALPTEGRRLACLVMAAGDASRFGSPKQLAELNGKLLIEYILDSAKPVFGPDLYSVLGANTEQINTIIKDRAQIIFNPNWQQGLGTSIAAGIAFLSEHADYDGVIIVLADQYRISTDDLAYLCEQFSEDMIIATEYGKTAGVPALFPRKYFTALASFSGAKGAKSLLNSDTPDVQRITMSSARFDIDTPEDFSRAQLTICS
jgi:molybdenum cofactor cytidylyltransferase